MAEKGAPCDGASPLLRQNRRAYPLEGFAKMRALVALCALLAGLDAFAQEQASITDVETFEGTFTGTKDSKLPHMGLTAKWTVSGRLRLTKLEPRYAGDERWEGTAEATQTVKGDIDLPPSKGTIRGTGRTTGTARMRFTPRGYQIDVKLPNISATETTSSPLGTRTRQIKESFGSIHMPGTVPLAGYDLLETATITLDAHTRTYSWDLKGTPGGELVAVPRVAPVVRGAKSHLDGTASRKREKIRSWRWTLKPAADCPPGVPSKTLDGEQGDVLLLCSMSASLVVSDGTKSSREVSATATVRPRDWHTKRGPVKGPDRIPALGLVSNHMLFGEAICAVEEGPDAEAAGHVFHRNSPATWRGSTYELSVVADPKSPFDGWDGLSENKSRYARRVRLNRELYPGSATGLENSQYPDRARDLARIKGCVERHEREHDTQIQRRLAGDWDPVRVVEKMFGKSEATLASDVDTEFAKAEEKFGAANFFEADVQRAIANGGCELPATIRVRQSDGTFQNKTFPKVSAMGEVVR
jgi:hypothetical protein